MRFFRYLLLIVILTSCKEQRDENYDYYISGSRPVNLPDTILLNKKISLNVRHIGSSGCDTYADHKIEYGKDTTKISIFIKRRKGVYCSAEIKNLTTTIEFQFDNPGKKILFFEGRRKELTFIDSVFVK